MKKKRMTSKQLDDFLREKDDYDELMAEAESSINFDIFIDELLQTKEITQKELAEKLNISQSSVSRLKGNPSNIRIGILIKLAAVFGKTIRINFEDTVKKSDKKE